MSAIDLATLAPVGKIDTRIENGALHATVTRAIHDTGYNIQQDKITSALVLAGHYKVPFQIDMTVKIDTPELIMLIGQGHVSFGSPWRENRRIEDMATPKNKPWIYDNHMPYNEKVQLRILCTQKAMQIWINGEERFYNTRMPYMKLPLEEVKLAITSTQHAHLVIHALSVMAYAQPPECLHTPFEPMKQTIIPIEKPRFEDCIAPLPLGIQAQIRQSDALLKSSKFKRIIEKHGFKITYVASDIGLSYALYVGGNVMHHSLQWYIITNGPTETWGRKANGMEEALNRAHPQLADFIFARLNDCIGCHSNCLARTPYEFNGQKKNTCHGHVFLKMVPEDFEAARQFLTLARQLF